MTQIHQLGPTPSQTVGPFFAYSLTAQQYGYDFNSIIRLNSLIDETTEGERIHIKGRIIDGQGNAINDGIIELWQSDIYDANAKNPIGFARLGTGTTPENTFTFTTVRPKATGGDAPHINVLIAMRGSLHVLRTRIYFSDETTANQSDKLLNSVVVERRQTLIAQRFEQNNQTYFHFDVVMQGENETVFFGF